MERLKKILFANKGWLLILLMGFVPLVWFRNDLLIAGGDLPIPLDPAGNFVRSFLYLWYPFLYGGEPNPHIFAILPWFGFWALLKSLGLSLLSINKLWFVFVFTLSGISMYYLISVLFKKKANFILLFVAPLFYMFNVYVMVVTPVMATPLLYGALPLILGLYIKGLDERENSSRYAVLVALSSLLICSAVGNPPIYAILGIMMLSYLVYHLVIQGKSQIIYSLTFTIKIGVLYFLLNLWWLYSYLTNVLFHSGDIAKAIQSYPSLGLSLLSDNIRLLGSWAFYAKASGAAYFPFAHYYKTPLLIILTFLIPIMAFTSVFFKFNKKTFYFLPMAVLGILLANGYYAGVTKLFFSLIPGFWIFREPFAKFTAVTAISFAVLIGFSTSKIYDFIQSRWNLSLARIYVLVVVLVILASSWPILTGDLIFSERGWMKSSHVKIPDYWFSASRWLNGLKGDFRVLVLPENPINYYCGLSYKWGYASADITPYLIHQPLIEERAGLGTSNEIELSTNLTQAVYSKIRNFEGGNLNIKTLAQALNVKYILQRNDVDWELISTENPFLYSPDHLRKALASEEYLYLEKSLGGLDFYKISDESFLPRFYIPQNISYSDVEIENLSDVVSFGDWNVRSAVFLADNTEKADEARRTMMERADEVFVKGELKSKVNEEGLGGVVAPNEEDVFFPYVRWKPGSLIYSLVLKKEQFDEWKVRKSTEKLLDKKLFYASKRISEIEKWGRETDLDKAFEKYRNEMEEVTDLLEGDSWQSERVLQQNILKTEVYLEAHWGKILEIGLDEERTEEAKEIFEKLQEKLENLKQKDDSSILVYNFEIPKEENYQLFIKNEEFSRYLRDIQLKLEILGEKRTIPLLSETETWISGGNFKLEKGEQELRLDIPQTVNLLGRDEWQSNLVESSFVKDKLITGAQLQLAFPEKSTVYFKPIENYQGDAFYKISFDYFAFRGEAGIVLIEDIGIKKRELMIMEGLSATKIDSPRHFEKIFKSTPGVKTAEFYFWGKIETNEDSKIKFFNVKIEKVVEPTIILRSTNHQLPITNYQSPRITFIKINPTKYKVKVEGAKGPYPLVFSESFHKGWKAYISDQWSVTSDQYGEVVASYFDGEIKEGTHRNIFLDGNTFETLGKKSLSEDKHLLVNGYANSWYITPKDAEGKEDYEIIIEYGPQKLFYVFLGILLITFLGCVGYLINGLIVKRK